MKTQKTIFNNDARIEPLIYSEEMILRLDCNQAKEYVTKNGAVVTIVKICKHIQGVGKYTPYFQVNDCGKIIEPLQSIGVKNYLKRN